MVGKVLDRAPHHLGRVCDRLEAGVADQCSRTEVPVVGPGLDDLLEDVVLRGERAQPRLVPGEDRRADPSAALVGIQEADLPVDARAVGLLIPPDAAVSDRPAVDLRDEDVHRRIAAVEMVVARGERFRCLDSVVALALRGRVMIRARCS